MSKKTFDVTVNNEEISPQDVAIPKYDILLLNIIPGNNSNDQRSKSYLLNTSHKCSSYNVPKQSHRYPLYSLIHLEPTKHRFSTVLHLSIHPSLTFSCLVAIRGTIGRRSEAALPELRTMSLMQPTKDSMMYLTPWSFSSELNPVKKIIKHNSWYVISTSCLLEAQGC